MWFGSSGGILDATSGNVRIGLAESGDLFAKIDPDSFPMSRINLFEMPKKVTWNLEPKCQGGCQGGCLGGGGNGEPTTFRERILVFEYEYSRVRPPPLRSALRKA